MKHIYILCLVLVLISSALADPIDIIGSISGFRNGQKLIYRDGLVYLLDFNSVYIIDVTDPASPDSVGGYRFDNYTLAIDISGDYAYVTYGQKIGLLDLSIPTAPEFITSYELGNYSYDLKVQGDLIYIASFTRAVILRHNASDEFELVGQISSLSDNKSINVSGNYAFAGQGERGFFVYNVTDPTSPSFSAAGDTPGWAVGIEKLGDYAFVADGAMVGVPGQASLRIFNVRNPASIFEAGFYISEGGNVTNTYPVNHYVVIADGTAGVKILDVDVVSSPELLGQRNDIGFINDVYFNEGYIYAMGRNTFYTLYTELIDTAAGETDTIPPVGHLVLPFEGAFTSCSDQPISFYLHDDESIDPSSIELNINGTAYSILDSRLTYSNDTLTFQPAFGWWMDGEFINFSLTQATDLEGNPAVGLPYTGSFTVDISFPTIDSPNPEPGSSTESNTPTISLTVYDDICGLDPTSLVLTVQGISYSYPDHLSWTGGILEYEPSTPFADSDTVEVCLTQAWDSPDYCEPNAIGEHFCWFFIVNPDWIPDTPGKPRSFELLRAYPNPFNSELTIEFNLAEVSNVKYQVFDINGLQVATICDKTFEPGIHRIKWDSGKRGTISTGVYLGRLSIKNTEKFQKLLLIK